MFWGWLPREVVGTLAPVHGNINSEKYTQCLDNNLWPAIAKVFGVNCYLFKDDNAMPHRPLWTSNWNTENTMDWVGLYNPQILRL